MTVYSFGPIKLQSNLELPLARSLENNEAVVSLRAHSVAAQTYQDQGFQIVQQGGRISVCSASFAGIRCSVREGKYINMFCPDEARSTGEWVLLSKLLPIAHMQRGHEVLHASSVCLNRRSILFLGDSGMGKSTTAAYCALQPDFTILGDDTAALVQADNRLNLISNSTYARLEHKIASVLDLQSRSSIFDKGFCTLPCNQKVCGQMVPVIKAYLLRKSERVELLRLSAADKFSLLLRSLWFVTLHRAVHRASHLARLKHLSHALDLSVLTFPPRIESLGCIVDLIRADCAASDLDRVASA